MNILNRLMPRLVRKNDETRQLQNADPWFYSHYVYAANIVAAKLGQHLDLRHSQLFDFGCGDGIMALGVSHQAGGVTGFDLTQAFTNLEERAHQTVHINKLPSSLRFMQVSADQPLPFVDNHFDGGYSWSVFEHVASVEAALAEVYRILKPGAVFFLQIEPLYYSPFGSHLQRLIDEPWAHLLGDETAYLQRVREARDTVPEEEKDLMYRENEFDHVKNYLITEYKTLNKLTAGQLLACALKAGFNILEMHITQVGHLSIPEALLKNYSAYDLRTNEIHLIISK